ncbi:MAG: hypothetical protein KGL35_23635, partial [Bradyrhizobium sp.]|nr:hypothetical protein [Bradyrhizobium sp.]
WAQGVKVLVNSGSLYGGAVFRVTSSGTNGQILVGRTALTFVQSAAGAGQVTIRKPARAATVAILSSDVEVGIDTRSTAVSANLPSAAAWAAANPFGLPLTLVDYYGNAAANNITPSLFAGDSFVWGGVTPVVNANFGLLALRPDASLPGWIVRGVN